jgi:hypothetical protein
MRMHARVQVLRYRESEQYRPHHDYFDPRLYAGNDAMKDLVQQDVRHACLRLFPVSAS